MTDPVAAFFAGSARRRTHLLPTWLSATIRFDLAREGRTDHWFVTLTRGELSVSQDGQREADCVVCADGAAFDRLLAGANPAAAVLRNEVSFRGRLLVFMYFQRLLPGPSGDQGPARIPIVPARMEPVPARPDGGASG
nr:SCP2 sterol-binding domain-containing protein [Micromonospora sp. DSM 115978]